MIPIPTRPLNPKDVDERRVPLSGGKVTPWTTDTGTGAETALGQEIRCL
jgi:hypothetical protein